jgi:hypothetical protein
MRPRRESGEDDLPTVPRPPRIREVTFEPSAFATEMDESRANGSPSKAILVPCGDQTGDDARRAKSFL